MRRGDYDEPELERQLDQRGFMNRFYGHLTRAVRKPWQMYPVGLLFGLGFDTATEIALLATAGTAAAGDLPLYAVLSLPILFAAGMSLFDTLDGAFMNFAYGWASFKPVRKVFYNMTITSLSVLVALVRPIARLVLSDSSTSDRIIASSPAWISSTSVRHVGLFVAIWASASRCTSAASRGVSANLVDVIR